MRAVQPDVEPGEPALHVGLEAVQPAVEPGEPARDAGVPVQEPRRPRRRPRARPQVGVAVVEHGRGHVVAMLGSLADAGRNDVCVLTVDARAADGPDEHYVIPDRGAGRFQGTKNGSGVEYHQRETPITMPKTKSDETDSRPAAAVASAGTTPDDLAHEIDLLGAALRLTPEQRAAARLSAAVVSSRPAADR